MSSQYVSLPVTGSGGGGITSINGDTTAAQVIAGGTGISVSSSGGTTTITNTGAGSGTVTTVSVVSAHGFAGTVANATSTPAITLSTTVTGLLQGNGTSISAYTGGNLTEATSSVLTISGGTGSVIGSGTSIQVSQASTSQSGYLSSTDWNTFNGKQPSGSYITALTGDGTASGPGSSALTLATVNSNVGSFGSSTAIPTFTVNGKGLITAASTVAVVAPAGTLSGTTLNSAVVTSSLTTVGTIGIGTWAGTTIAVSHGGTGLTTLTTGNVILGAGTSTPTFVAPGTSGNVLTSNGSTWVSQASSGGGISGTWSTTGNIVQTNGSNAASDTTVPITYGGTSGASAYLLSINAGGSGGTNYDTIFGTQNVLTSSGYGVCFGNDNYCTGNNSFVNIGQNNGWSSHPITGIAIGSGIGSSGVSGAGAVMIGNTVAQNGYGPAFVGIGNQVSRGQPGNDYSVAIGGYSLYYGGKNSVSIGYEAGGAVGGGVNGNTNCIYLGYTAGAHSTNENNVFYLDGIGRSSSANEKAQGLMYGLMSATVSSQTLAINAAVTLGAPSGTPIHALNTTSTTGSTVCTLGTNSPSTGTTPTGWIEIIINGTTSYIPYFQ
jgi:hypothetical protein